MVRSSDSQYAAAGPDPPWPPLLKGGKLGATNAEGNCRSSDREFSTGHPGAPFLRGEASRNKRGGKLPLLGSRLFNRPAWPRLLKGGKPGETFAA